MTFPPGKPVAIVLVLGLLASTVVMSRPRPRPAPLTMWFFSELNSAQIERPLADGSPSMVDWYAEQTGLQADVQILPIRSLDTRLVGLISSGATEGLPDLVEVEIGSVAKYLRAPVDKVGFYPLTEFLEEDDLGKRLIADRMKTWSKGGVPFLVPRDIHPVIFTYRKDLWDEAGIDVESIVTWPEFHAAGEKFIEYWRGQGVMDRYPIELPTRGVDVIIQMLLQRGICLNSHDGTVRLTDPKVVDTLMFYIRMIRGPRAIAIDTSGALQREAIEIETGARAGLLAADWRLRFMRRDAPDCRGKLAIRPLFIFDPGDRPTSTWGGTAIGIPRNAKDPKASWDALNSLYFSERGLMAWRQKSDIIPPVIEHSPMADEPDAFYSNQPVRRILEDLAREVPVSEVTPFTSFTRGELVFVLSKLVRNHELPDEQLRPMLEGWLADAQKTVERRIAFSKFEDAAADGEASKESR